MKTPSSAEQISDNASDGVTGPLVGGAYLAALRAELRDSRARHDAASRVEHPPALAESGLDNLRKLLGATARQELSRAKRRVRAIRSLIRTGSFVKEPAHSAGPTPLRWIGGPALPTWGDPIISAIIWESEGAPEVARLACAAGQQSLSRLEIVVVSSDGRSATRIGRDGEPLETWDISEPSALARTVLGKFVCLLAPSFRALPETFLEMNALALEGHDLDIVVNGFGPEPLLTGAFLERRIPNTTAGQPSRPLLVFRAEYLGTDGTFDASRLGDSNGPRGRVIGRWIRHEFGAGAPFESPAEWRCRLDSLGGRLQSNGRELLLGGTRSEPIVASLRDFSDHAPALAPRGRQRPRVLVSFPFLAVGGAEKLTYDILNCLRDRFEFSVITAEPADTSVGSTVSAFRRLTPLVYQAPDFLHPGLNTPLACYLIQKLGIETLFVANGSNWFYDALPTLKRRFPRLRVVNQVFDHNFGWINRYTPGLAAHIDAHVAPNRAIADTYARFGIPLERIRLIPHGIDLAAFDRRSYDDDRRSALRRDFGIPEGPRVVSFIARIHPQKRPTDFLNLADRFRNDPGFIFLMVGDGPAERDVATMAAELKLPNLRRLAFHQPVQDVMAITDILVITSEYEGLPLVLLNCLAMGVPVVATDVGSIGDVLTPNIGVLVPKIGDVRSLEEGVRLLATRLGCELSTETHRAVSAGFDITAVANQYAEALEGNPS